MPDTNGARTLVDHALAYAAAGFHVFPLEPRGEKSKAPIGALVPHGQKQATVDPDTIARWWQARPDALIGHWLPAGTVLLDVDPKHGGGQVWKALKAEHGAELLTRVHYSGRGDGGGHIWFDLEVPDGHRLAVTRLDAWAEERGLGAQLQTKWTCGIDLLHHGHRYTILPPSPHPDTGQPYDWRGQQDSPVAPMPAWLADLIVQAPAIRPSASRLEPQGDSIADWFTATATWGQLLGRHGWQPAGGDGESDGSRWKHPQATNAHSATIRHDCLFVYTSSTCFEETTDSDPHGYTKFRAWAELEHRGDASTAARAARELKNGPRTPIDDSWAGNASFPGARAEHPQVNGIVAHQPTNLPDSFWAARPILEHIRQAAWNRSASPDAVLAAVLARHAAYSSHQYEIPPVVGTPASLNFYVAIVAPSGTGKSIAQGISGELLGPPAFLDVADDLPLGSGEGLAEAYMGEKEEEDEKGKRKMVRQQVRHNAFVTIDEGAAITAMMERSGATILEALRRGWSGATLGQANASQDRRRIIPAGTYRLGLVVAFQPELAGKLLADLKAGTPQRFLFASAIDPAIPDDEPDWPGILRLPAPGTKALEAHKITSRGQPRIRLGVDPEIAGPLKAQHKAKSRGQRTIAELDSHEPVHRLKVAALLALLDGRLDIDLDDWALADVVWTTSCAMRTDVVRAVAIEAERNERDQVARRARGEVVVEAARRSVPAKVTQLGARLARWVQEQTAAGELPGGATRGQLGRRVASHERELLDAALAEAVDCKLLEETTDGRWSPGTVTVARP